MVFDTETESVNSFHSRPWEVAWLIASQKEIIREHRHFPLWKDINVSRDAARITGFNKEEYLRKAEPADKILKFFEKDLYNEEYIKVGHNLFFDAGMHGTWRRCLGQQPNWSWLNKFLCTDCLSKAYKKGIAPDHKNLLLWFFKMKSVVEKGLKSNLGQMCREFDIELDETQQHRGEYDIVRTYELLKKLLFCVEI